MSRVFQQSFNSTMYAATAGGMDLPQEQLQVQQEESSSNAPQEKLLNDDHSTATSTSSTSSSSTSSLRSTGLTGPSYHGATSFNSAMFAAVNGCVVNQQREDQKQAAHEKKALALTRILTGKRRQQRNAMNAASA